MRKVTAEIDDKGRIEVKIDVPKDRRGFLSKRDIDRVIKSIKLEYRRDIREHRRKLILRNELEIKEDEDSSRITGRSEEEDTGPKDRNETAVRSEQVRGSDEQNSISRSSGDGLARAIEQKLAQRRGREAREGSGEDEERRGSSEAGS